MCEYLVTLGFEIVGRNVRFGALEADILAQRNELAVLVEVRTRRPGAHGSALEGIGWRKQQFILRTAERAWRDVFSKRREVERFRIDVATVSLGPTSAHLVDYIEAAITR